MSKRLSGVVERGMERFRGLGLVEKTVVAAETALFLGGVAFMSHAINETSPDSLTNRLHDDRVGACMQVAMAEEALGWDDTSPQSRGVQPAEKIVCKVGYTAQERVLLFDPFGATYIGVSAVVRAAGDVAACSFAPDGDRCFGAVVGVSGGDWSDSGGIPGSRLVPENPKG